MGRANALQPGGTRRVSTVTAIVAALTMLISAAAYAADLVTDATLSTDASVPSILSIGSNPFTIKLSATGNLKADRNATVVNKYFMATDGTIAPSSDAGDVSTVSFAMMNYGNGTNQNCGSTPTPAGCAANPHTVAATIVVATGTPDGRTGLLQISHRGADDGLTADATLDTYQVKVVVLNTYEASFQRPVTPSSSSSVEVNRIKNGRVVPIKGEVQLGTTVMTDLNKDANTLFQIKVSGAKCTSTDDAPTLVTEFADAGESSAGTQNFRYEDGFWTYNLDTKALGLQTGKCYKVEMMSKAGTASAVAMTNQWVILEVVR